MSEPQTNEKNAFNQRSLLIQDPYRLVQKIQFVQQNMMERKEELFPSIIEASRELSTNVCRVVTGGCDTRDIIELISKVEASGIMPDEVLAHMKRLPNYIAVIAESEDHFADQDILFATLHDLEQVVEWYYGAFLQEPVPPELEEFIAMNKGEPQEVLLPEPLALPETEKPAEGGESSPFNITDRIRFYRVPEYAKKLVMYNNEISNSRNRDSIKSHLTEINQIYENVGLKDDITKACFFLICSRIVLSKKPVRYKDFFNHVLKWSVSAAAKNIRQFPSTEQALATTLENLFAYLSDQGILFIEENGPDDRLIGLLGLEAAEDKREKEFLKRVFQRLEDEWEKSKREAMHPYPTLGMFSRDFQRAGIDLEQFLQRLESFKEIPDGQNAVNTFDTPLLAIAYNNPDKDSILLSREYYQALPAISAMKMLEYFRNLLGEKMHQYDPMSIINRINTLLRKSFPADNKDLQSLLSPEKVSARNLWTDNDPNLNLWIFIFRDLYDNSQEIFKHSTPSDRSMVQSLAVLYQLVMARREAQVEKQEKRQFRDTLIKQIATQEKVGKNFLRQEWAKKNDTPNMNEEEASQAFVEFLAAFLEEFSIRRSPNSFIVPVPVIDQRSKKMEEYYAHSSRLLDLYKKNLDLVTDRENGIKQRGFIKRLVAVIDNNTWFNDTGVIVRSLDSDESFAAYMLEYIRLYYNELYVIDALFDANNEMLRYLVKVRNENPSHFFNKDLTKKSLMRFINVTRFDILKQMKGKRGLFSRIIDFILGLIPFLKKKVGARQELFRALNRQMRAIKGQAPARDTTGQEAKGWEELRSESAGGTHGERPSLDTSAILNKLFTPRTGQGFTIQRAGAGPRSAGGAALQGKGAGGMAADTEKKKKMKILQFKKELLREDNLANEAAYLNFYLKKWSMKPADDPQIVRQILVKKDVGQNLNWLMTIRKDIDKMNSLGDYRTAIQDVARAVMHSYGKKHITESHLVSYLAMFVLVELEKGF